VGGGAMLMYLVRWTPWLNMLADRDLETVERFMGAFIRGGKSTT